MLSRIVVVPTTLEENDRPCTGGGLGWSVLWMIPTLEKDIEIILARNGLHSRKMERPPPEWSSLLMQQIEIFQ